MAAYTCVYLRQLWLSYFDDIVSQVLPPGLHWGRHSGHGIFLWLCVFVLMCVCLRAKPTLSWVCFFFTQVSVPVYKCTCHVMPVSKLEFAVNLTLCLKAVGMERDKENLLWAEAALTCAFLSYQKPANAKIKQKKGVFYLLCIYPGSLTETKDCQTSTKYQISKSIM